MTCQKALDLESGPQPPHPADELWAQAFLFSPPCLLYYIHLPLLFCFLQGCQDFPGSLDGKESTCNAGDPGVISGSGRSPGEGNDNPLQYFHLGNIMDKRTLGRLQPMELQRIRHDLAFQKQRQGYRAGTLLPASL